MGKNGIIAAIAGSVASATALQFVPPAGYSGKPGLSVAETASEPGGPRLMAIPIAQRSHLITVDPSYRRDDRRSHVKVVGAFAVSEPAGAHLIGASSPGFLPVIFSFSNGDCYSLDADYVGGALSNGKLKHTECQPSHIIGDVPPSPTDPAMRLVGHAWGYGAWVDARKQLTTVSAPYCKTFQPLFTADMAAVAIMAMNGPDYPGGDVTLVGIAQGRLIVVTMEVAW